jgi:hypothetical protein
MDTSYTSKQNFVVGKYIKGAETSPSSVASASEYSTAEVDTVQVDKNIIDVSKRIRERLTFSS